MLRADDYDDNDNTAPRMWPSVWSGSARHKKTCHRQQFPPTPARGEWLAQIYWTPVMVPRERSFPRTLTTHHCCRWLGAEPFWEKLSHCCNTISRWYWSVPCAKGRGNDGDDDAKLTQQCQADDREKWSHVVDCGWPAVLQIDSTKLYSFRFSLNV